MDRKTREFLNIFAQGRQHAQQEGDTEFDNLMQTMEKLCRILKPGTVILERERGEERNIRLDARRRARDYRQSIDRFLTFFEEVNQRLGRTADAILMTLGYRRHDRGEWRLRCTSTVLLQLHHEVTAMTSPNQTQPLIVHVPPDMDPEMQKLFAKAQTGDEDALARVRGLIRDRRWVEWLGNLGEEATRQLLKLVSSGSPVWTIGLEEKVAQLLTEVQGEKPSVLEKLLARCVINNWIAVHALEVERGAKDPKGDQLECVEKAIGRAYRRLQLSIHELARVRRLQAPKVLAQSVRRDVVYETIPLTGPPQDKR